MARADPDHKRLAFILSAQDHCDEYLSRIADPRGKTVLVLGAGAGTEMLWCLRHGAREVVGVDLAVQSPEALAQAMDEVGLVSPAPHRLEELAVEEAPSLGRTFDLVLSNNTFEHLLELERAFEVCAEMVEPEKGRIAIFTDPLYYSSVGSHLEIEPWEHLWGEAEEVRSRLLAGRLDDDHPLAEMDLRQYLDEEISLNRMRLGDFLEGIRKSNLLILGLGVVRDRHVGELPAYLSRILERPEPPGLGLSITDLVVEGIWAELAKPPVSPIPAPDSPSSPVYVSTEEEERYRQRQLRKEMEAQIEDLQGRVCRLYVDTGDGYSQEQSLTHRLADDDAEWTLDFDLSPWDRIQGFRFDPTENRHCDLELEAVTHRDPDGQEHVLDLDAIETNGVPLGPGRWSFDTLDPMLLLPCRGRVQRLTLTGRRRLWGPYEGIERLRRAQDRIDALETDKARLIRQVQELEGERRRLEVTLVAVEASPSWRLGRFLTAPARWWRDRGSRSGSGSETTS